MLPPGLSHKIPSQSIDSFVKYLSAAHHGDMGDKSTLEPHSR